MMLAVWGAIAVAMAPVVGYMLGHRNGVRAGCDAERNRCAALVHGAIVKRGMSATARWALNAILEPREDGGLMPEAEFFGTPPKESPDA